MPKTNDRVTQAARREQAEKRQAVYEALTTEEKLARIEFRRGNSAKEKARLSA